MAELLTVWWVWIAFALALGLVEVLAPGFIFLGFALGALATGAIVGLVMPALASPLGLPALLAIFAALSLLAWILLRVVFRKQSSGARRVLHDIND